MYLDDKLVIDLGGFHEAQESTLSFDSLGLTIGKEYIIRFFYAQRHTIHGSTLRIQHNLFSHPKQCGLFASGIQSEVKAGDTLKLEVKYQCDGIPLDIPGGVEWGMKDLAGVNGSEVLNDLGNGRCNFTPTKAYTTVMIWARYNNPEETITISDTAYVQVVPGDPELVSIELSSDSLVSLRDAKPLDTVKIGASESQKSIFAVIRDRFANWLYPAYPATWTSENPSCVGTAAGQHITRGEGLVQRSSESGGATRLFVISNQGFMDTVLVNVENASLLSGHILAGGSEVQLKAGSCLFRIDKPGYAVLRIYDLAGRLKADMFGGLMPAGTMVVRMPELGAGAYLLKFECGGKIQQRRVVLK